MRPKPLVFFTVVGLLAAFAIYRQADSSGKPVVGSMAPEFELKDRDGNLMRLSDFRGQFVFLNFWATWCEPCIEEMPDMMRMNEAFAGMPFQMLAVSVDTNWNVIDDFYGQYEIDLPTLLDPAQQVSRGRYKVTGFPETFLIDGDGRIVRKVIGAERWADPGVIAAVRQMIEERAGEGTGSSTSD